MVPLAAACALDHCVFLFHHFPTHAVELCLWHIAVLAEVGFPMPRLFFRHRASLAVARLLDVLPLVAAAASDVNLIRLRLSFLHGLCLRQLDRWLEGFTLVTFVARTATTPTNESDTGEVEPVFAGDALHHPHARRSVTDRLATDTV